MSTVSNCTRTSADSAWGIEQIRKEIYIDFSSHEISHENEANSIQDSCNGHLTYNISNETNVQRNHT